MTKFLQVSFFIVILSSLAMAGTTGKIAGKIIDKKSGELIIGANIQIENTAIGAATNLDGEYSIVNISPGTYTISVVMIGYKTVKTTNVHVRSDLTTIINFELIPTTLESSEIIEVFAQRPLIQRDQTSSLAEFSGEEIRVMPVETFQEVLSVQAGVTVGADGALHIRGGRASEVSYVVDGIPITDQYSGLPSVAVENNSIQELSLVSGAFNAEYGEALSGIVNIVTREGGEKWEFSGQAYSGDYFSSNKKIFYNIDKVQPAAIYNLELNGGGPLPLDFKIFTSVRLFKNEGWLYGRRDFNIADSTNLNSENREDWFIKQTGDSAAVSLNDFERFSISTKLSRQIGNGKLSYNLLWNNSNYQNYIHQFKYTPDGNYNQVQEGVSHSLRYNYAFSDKAFLEAGYGFKKNNYRFSAFKNPLDKRYVDPDRLKIAEFRFYTGGVGMAYLKRETQTHFFNTNFTWQINKEHLLKTGVAYEQNNLFLREFTIDAKRDNNGVELRPFQPYVQPTSTIGSNKYDVNPFKFSVFIQDKIELNSVVINAGMRFDYFDANAGYPVNLGDPTNSAIKAADPKLQYSPRLGVAYPLTATGILHFSFGLFFQMPPYQYLYTNPEFEVAIGSLASTMGNANLEPQQTTIYELGLQQQFSNDFAGDFTLYVKDIRNLLSQEIFRLDNDVSSRYVRYTNRDYGRVAGVSVFLEKRMSGMWSATLNYTYQIARGNASDPNALFFDLLASPPRESEKNIVNLDWDQRHTLNGTITLAQPGKWYMSLLGTYGSGLPYTPSLQNQRTSFENSDRKPASLNFDLRAGYDLKFSNYTITLFTLINNLFDTLNENIVYDDTGRSGYTLRGRFVGNTGLYDIGNFLNRPDFYTEPRRIVVGISIH
jgi:outer membrane receptor for ferrienterochelin and colicin